MDERVSYGGFSCGAIDVLLHVVAQHAMVSWKLHEGRIERV